MASLTGLTVETYVGNQKHPDRCFDLGSAVQQKGEKSECLKQAISPRSRGRNQTGFAWSSCHVTGPRFDEEKAREARHSHGVDGVKLE